MNAAVVWTSALREEVVPRVRELLADSATG